MPDASESAPEELAPVDDITQTLNPHSLEVLTGCKLEPSLAEAVPGERYQFERLGYFCSDTQDSTPSHPVF